MTIQRRSVFVVLAMLAGLIVVRLVESDKRFDFGHPGYVDAALWSLLWLLGITHGVLAVIAWMQRKDWTPSEASMFRFLAAKSIFWINAGTQFGWNGLGIRLDTIMLYLMMGLTTIDLDIKMFNRFVRGMEEPTPDGEDVVIYDGPERRSGDPGRRATDWQRGMR